MAESTTRYPLLEWRRAHYSNCAYLSDDLVRLRYLVQVEDLERAHAHDIEEWKRTSANTRNTPMPVLQVILNIRHLLWCTIADIDPYAPDAKNVTGYCSPETEKCRRIYVELCAKHLDESPGSRALALNTLYKTLIVSDYQGYRNLNNFLRLHIGKLLTADRARFQKNYIACKPGAPPLQYTPLSDTRHVALVNAQPRHEHHPWAELVYWAKIVLPKANPREFAFVSNRSLNCLQQRLCSSFYYLPKIEQGTADALKLAGEAAHATLLCAYMVRFRFPEMERESEDDELQNRPYVEVICTERRTFEIYDQDPHIARQELDTLKECIRGLQGMVDRVVRVTGKRYRYRTGPDYNGDPPDDGDDDDADADADAHKKKDDDAPAASAPVSGGGLAAPRVFPSAVAAAPAAAAGRRSGGTTGRRNLELIETAIRNVVPVHDSLQPPSSASRMCDETTPRSTSPFYDSEYVPNPKDNTSTRRIAAIMVGHGHYHYPQPQQAGAPSMVVVVVPGLFLLLMLIPICSSSSLLLAIHHFSRWQE